MIGQGPGCRAPFGRHPVTGAWWAHHAYRSLILGPAVHVNQLALQTVHTTGVNWESVAVIVGSLVACLTFLGTIIERRNRQIRSDITGAVTHLGEVLGERLETKSNVAALSGRVAVLEAERARRRRWLLGRGALPPPPPVVYAKTYTEGKGNPR